MGLEQGELDVTVIPAVTNIALLYREFLRNAGSADMIVNGSGTPVVFSVSADPTNTLTLVELRIVFTANSLDWGGAAFGAGGGALTNGLLIETDVGGTVTTLGNPTINENILQLPVRNDVLLGQGGNRDVLALSVDFGTGLVLTAGSADEVRATVRDNLTTGARQIAYLRMSVFGTSQAP